MNSINNLKENINNGDVVFLKRKVSKSLGYINLVGEFNAQGSDLLMSKVVLEIFLKAMIF